jgi:dTDP-4-amino-4,6-dideoxygalactose transaminase
MSALAIRWWRTDMGAAEAQGVAAAIAARHINGGPACRALEAALAAALGVPHAALTTSGSAALLLAYWACGVGPGDEVIMPAAGFIATAHAALMLGAQPVIVDVEADRPLLSAAATARAITPRTKLIVPVHLNGAACDMPALLALAAQHGLRVVEDCAQALGSRGPHGQLGTQGDAGAFSMGITKLITTGEGGFVATRAPALMHELMTRRNHGVLAIARNVFDKAGFNLRFNDLLASVGQAQLDQLPHKLAALRRVRAFYAEALRALPYLRLMKVRVGDGELPLWTEVLCAERDRVAALLAARGIETKVFHPCVNDSAHVGARAATPNARRFAALGLTLPSGPDQTADDLARVAAALHDLRADIRVTIDEALAAGTRS